jgi:tRNA A-37 threonylcarbamoyl transferase component Bud32
MARRLKDLLAQRAAASFVGRHEEIATLLTSLADEGPVVVHINGIGGVGKSALLNAFAARAREQGAAVIQLDCRVIEPTERGFLHELGSAIGAEISSPDEAAVGLGDLADRVILVIDTYEVFRLLATWLRQVFIPSLPENVRVVLAGRQPPSPTWLASPEWHGLFLSMPLGPLGDDDARELLVRAGLGAEAATRINAIARGHPLALHLAASTAQGPAGPDLQDSNLQTVVEQLAHIFLSDVEDPLIRQTLEAASVTRRVTKSLIGAMVPDADPEDVYVRLERLPFVEANRDGLSVHDSVREAIGAALHAADPARYCALKGAAWCQLRAEVAGAPATELWRYTADMLYLIENPVTREAFFPSGAQELLVEPARPEDGSAIHAITELHEGGEAAGLIDYWWEQLPDAFHVVRGGSGSVVGYYLMFDPDRVEARLFEGDPLVEKWWRHLEEVRGSAGETALFLRRWLGRDAGEAPSPVQAAAWLDVKRAYMALRPDLRRVYLTVIDLPAYAQAAATLGFAHLPESGIEADDHAYQTAMLDFGPGSVDDWLARLAAAELGIDDKPAETTPVVAHYRILERVGRGGMGIVYRAEDTVLKRHVALKFLPEDLLDSESTLERFMREARTAAALNHPNICTIHEVGRVGPDTLDDTDEGAIPAGSPFIAMELVDGSTLRQLLDRPELLSIRKALDIAIQIAEGLVEAHTSGVVHRDLKPQNVMVTSKGQAKILDFGVAKAVGEAGAGDQGVTSMGTAAQALTREGGVVGTLAYMSPEQVGGRKIDARSDVFAFGTTLYEMVSGQHPFLAGTATQTTARIFDADPRPLLELRSDLPPDLGVITHRCLRGAPDERYNDTRDLLLDLKLVRDSLGS